jgi:hypothetical protein
MSPNSPTEWSSREFVCVDDSFQRGLSGFQFFTFNYACNSIFHSQKVKLGDVKTSKAPASYVRVVKVF